MNDSMSGFTPEMRWHAEPPQWRLHDGALDVRTGPRTDFWRHTHYGFVRDDGHIYGLSVAAHFDMEVVVDGAYRDQYDQAGLALRLSAEQWIKCGVEYVHGRRLVSAVVTDGQSDWSVAPASSDGPVRVVVRRRAGAVTVHVGARGAEQLLRLAPFPAGPVLAGPMAASPDGEGFDVVFTSFGVDLEPSE